MHPNLKFKILAEGFFDKNHIEIKYLPRKIAYSVEAARYIEEKWKTALDTTKRLFNGLLFNLDKRTLIDGVLKLNLSNTTYKEFYVSRTDEFAKKFGTRFVANPVSVGAVIETSDSKILFGKRKTDLDFDPGYYGILAGMMDREKDLKGNAPVPFSSLLREFKEEKCVELEEIQAVHCIGAVYNSLYRQTYLPFAVKLKIDGKTLLKKRSIEEEFDSFLLVSSEKEAIKAFLSQNKQNMSQACIANLIMWLKETSIR